MQNRIDRLESLVLSLMSNGSQSTGPSTSLEAASGDSSASSIPNPDDMGTTNSAPAGLEESDTEQVTKSFGILKVDNNKSYYLSEAHWASVLTDVSDPHSSYVYSSLLTLYHRLPK